MTQKPWWTDNLDPHYLKAVEEVAKICNDNEAYEYLVMLRETQRERARAEIQGRILVSTKRPTTPQPQKPPPRPNRRPQPAWVTD